MSDTFHIGTHCPIEPPQRPLWTIETLILKISNREITKPCFQRKLLWKRDTTPGHANIHDYIVFLYKFRDNIEPLSVGEKLIGGKKHYTSIDGNNRMWAIYEFIWRPLSIFDHPIGTLTVCVNRSGNINDNEKKQLVEYICLLNYESLFKFRRMRDLYVNNPIIKNIIEKLELDIQDGIEDWFTETQNMLSLDGHGNKSFISIQLLTNVFVGYTVDQLSAMFSDLNKCKNKMSTSELLASTLCHVKINTSLFPTELIEALKHEIVSYYDDKAEGEAVSSDDYSPEEGMNAFEFIVALQNHIANSPTLSFKNTIDLFEPTSISILFKIYKRMFGSYDDSEFTDTNVSSFVARILAAAKILVICYNKMFSEAVCLPMFKGKNILKNFKLNTTCQYVILVYIIQVLDNPDIMSVIENRVSTVMMYHFLIAQIKNTETKSLHIGYDKIDFKGAGMVVENKLDSLRTNPAEFGSTDMVPRMYSVLRALINETISLPKKRKDPYSWEIWLMAMLYRERVSVVYLNERFDKDHIVPFSCAFPADYAGSINRIGNMIPYPAKLNRSRGNGPISHYDKGDLATLRPMIPCLPTNEIYDLIVSYEPNPKKPIVRSVDLYEAMCDRNENIYMDTFVKQVMGL